MNKILFKPRRVSQLVSELEEEEGEEEEEDDDDDDEKQEG